MWDPAKERGCLAGQISPPVEREVCREHSMSPQPEDGAASNVLRRAEDSHGASCQALT